ncbi:DUF4173 domain-containing protein [Pedobacter sp. BMA]|uniref:DUF4153 domain-containing protein n=1 Tax=Pedobacter sp. BMA TaxID=1663685 RepID=UPI00064A5A80|nr:DUF4173 domain-containing protein [Pedobacter sp. BMA]KLT65559.1 hypothetical protein AB669_10825 [Pedobacter sp. BMA]
MNTITNKSNFLLLSALFGALLFSLIFWQERLALNLLIYTAFLTTVTWLNTDVAKTPKFYFFAAAHLLAAILVVINNSFLSLAACYVSLVIFIGFSHNQQIRTVFTAFLATILQMITVPFNTVRNLSEINIGRFNLKPLFKLIKYVFIPFIIFFIFACLYSAANSVFAHYGEALLTSFGNFFTNIFGFLFTDLSFPRFMHFCFGLVLTSAFVFTFFNKGLQTFELKFKEDLLRLRKNIRQKTIWFEVVSTFSGNLLTRKLALKTEFISALVSFSVLNLLLLFLNAIDITTLWFGYTPSGNFSADLHDGTNTLIFSILLAMLIIIYFFRGNLNFYKKSKTLRLLTYIWIVQNALLIVSVLIRDGYYIEFYGLTHKRIGVLVFALLCSIGLITVYVKVARQKTFFFLLKINGYIWFILLLAFSTINWDVFIAKYNLSRADSITLDAGYLLSLSDKTLPELDKNRSKLISTDGNNAFYPKQLDERIGYFKERYQSFNWVSWNLPDWRTAKYFSVHKNQKGIQR